MSGDKVTGFNPVYKSSADFTRELALIALSDAKHDFGGSETYNTSIEDILKKGLPHTFTAADNDLTAVEEDKVIEYVYNKSQENFFADIRASEDRFFEIKTKLGSSLIHTHNAKALKLYDENDRHIQSLTGTKLVDLLDINNANLIVDLDAIGFMSALKTGPNSDKTVNYLLVSESFNDPASRQGLNSDIFNIKEGIKLQSLLQYGGLPLGYRAWNSGQQAHNNDYFSKYNFILSPVLEPKKGKFNTNMTITNPSAETKVFLDDPKKDNSITAIKKKLGDIITKFFKRPAGTEEGIFQRNVKYQQKRSGDWLQALAIQDIFNRNFVDINKRPVNIFGENYLVTHDRIALVYALLTGSSAIFVHNWKKHGRFVYIFKKVKPVPVIMGTRVPDVASTTQVMPEDILLNYYKNTKGFEMIIKMYRILKTKYKNFNLYLDKFQTELESLSDRALTLEPKLDTIRVLLEKLATYVYMCSNVPNYNELANLLEFNYNTIKGYSNSDSEEKKNNINRLNSLFNNILAIINIKATDRINVTEFEKSAEYKSIQNINLATNLDDYKGLHYITNNSINDYKIYNLRNLVAATFEQLLRLPYFDRIERGDDIVIQRLLILGLTDLSTEKPDPKIIQTFNQRVKDDILLNEAAVFKIEEETADILMNFSRGYDYLVSFHLQNDPIFRESLETENEVTRAFYGGISGGGKVITTKTITQQLGRQPRTRHKHVNYTRPELRKMNRGERLRLAQGVTVFATRPSTFKKTMGARKPSTFTGIGRAEKTSYSAKAIEGSSTVAFYGHHPFTPLLYLQYKILPYILENDDESPDYVIYLMLGKIINVLIYRLNELMKKGNDSKTVLGGIILKYLLFIAIPKQKHLGLLFNDLKKVGFMGKQLSILLGLLTESVDLHYNEKQERAFSRLFERPDIAPFINNIRDELSNLTVNSSKAGEFASKTKQNIKHMYASIKNVGKIVATRKRSVFAPVVVGTKRKRSKSYTNTSSSNNMESSSKRKVSSPKTKRAKRSHKITGQMITLRPTIRVPSNSL
jgi:hypothetical protein